MEEHYGAWRAARARREGGGREDDEAATSATRRLWARRRRGWRPCRCSTTWRSSGACGRRPQLTQPCRERWCPPVVGSVSCLVQRVVVRGGEPWESTSACGRRLCADQT
eukprot:scaffold5148_cov551-Prasinococcus_capsulatus_cf.AAC.1